jgi:hypothetical protein
MNMVKYYPFYTGTSTSTSTTGYVYVDSHNIGNANIPDIDELKIKLKNLEELFFRKVVSKCPACGQWGAAMCECKYCGHPVDMGEVPDGIQPLPK